MCEEGTPQSRADPTHLILVSAEGRLANEGRLVEHMRSAGFTIDIFRSADDLLRMLPGIERYHIVVIAEHVTVNGESVCDGSPTDFDRRYAAIRGSRAINLFMVQTRDQAPVFRGGYGIVDARMCMPPNPDELVSFIRRARRFYDEGGYYRI